MTDAEHMNSVADQVGWRGNETDANGEQKRPGSRRALILAVVIFAVTAGSGGWVYLEGSRLLHLCGMLKSQGLVLAPPYEELLWQCVRRLQLAATLVAWAAGIAFALGALARYRRRQEVQALHSTLRSGEWETGAAFLRAQLAEQGKTAAALLEQREELQGQIAALSRANATLEGELNRRKQAEKTLAQQRQELARSKDVLEMHVQARTQELQKFQRRYELILNSAGEGICGLDLQGKITFVNPAAARLMDWNVKEMVGRADHELSRIFEPNGHGAAGRANGDRPAMVMVARQDGSNFAAEYVRSPILENDLVVGEVLLFKYITERKQAEETLAQKAAELARSNAELEQFAFVASHDLQEPLRKIQAFGDRLKAKCDAVKLDEGRDYLQRMQNAAARMQTLINDLLTFSRVISRTEPFVAVDLNVLTREVLGDLEVLIEKTGAKVEVAELPTLEADPLQMRQLLQNLIGNALKFQPPGAVPTVRIQGRVQVQPTVHFVNQQPAGAGDTAVSAQFCELTIQDNGIGFDEVYLEKIFAVFQRLHGRNEYEGTGIGLAVCRRIVDRHGGTITARSKPGEGATFTVRLPTRQPRKAKGPG